MIHWIFPQKPYLWGKSCHYHHHHHSRPPSLLTLPPKNSESGLKTVGVHCQGLICMGICRKRLFKEWWSLFRDSIALTVCDDMEVVAVAFSLHAKIEVGGGGETFDEPVPIGTFFCVCVEKSLCLPSSLFKPGSIHSGSASLDDRGCIPWRVTSELIPHIVIGSDTMPGEHSQSTLTLLGQGCMLVYV